MRSSPTPVRACRAISLRRRSSASTSTRTPPGPAPNARRPSGRTRWQQRSSRRPAPRRAQALRPRSEHGLALAQFVMAAYGGLRVDPHPRASTVDALMMLVASALEVVPGRGSPPSLIGLMWCTVTASVTRRSRRQGFAPRLRPELHLAQAAAFAGGEGMGVGHAGASNQPGVDHGGRVVGGGR